MAEDYFYKQNTLPTLTDQEEDDAPLPEKIGPYKIDALLSKGGMSLLYLGFDPKTREARAIKVLSPSYVNHPEMVDHFLSEAKIISLASHPNIVKVYDHGKWEGGLYIAMEFIRGVSLSQFIAQQSFSLKRSLSIVLQIAYALCHLHTHGVIHRDLKPENILIAEDGETKVIDFGIAQLHEESGASQTAGALQGTPSYMSPEQRTPPHLVSFTSDIYALGVIAYELIVGKLSYGIINLSLLPQSLQKIIGKAIAFSTEERYLDIVDFITDITHYMSSSDLQKERASHDRGMETLEILQQADLSLSPSQTPSWSDFDMGLARHRLGEQFGLYIDFFKLANNTYAILLAKALEAGPRASVSLGILKGMIQVLMRPKLQKTEPFSPAQLASDLSSLLYTENLKKPFAFAALKLVPLNDSITFLSCGLGPLLHLPQGSQSVRPLHSSNPLLGDEPISTFVETSDNWREGDWLVLHGFSAEEMQALETPLSQSLVENALLSPLPVAHALLKRGLSALSSRPTHPTLVLTLQRI